MGSPSGSEDPASTSVAVGEALQEVPAMTWTSLHLATGGRFDGGWSDAKATTNEIREWAIGLLWPRITAGLNRGRGHAVFTLIPVHCRYLAPVASAAVGATLP
jgi:hypothetical protein